MSLAGLYNVPQTPDQLAEWSFINAAAHADINRVIFQRTGQVLTSFVLDPINMPDLQNWLANHQIMHQQMDAVLGIAGYDLFDVDWTDRGQFAAWIQDHAAEHLQAGQILNLG
jgi:NAD dependent epimerase/dehydratase family enzyme